MIVLSYNRQLLTITKRVYLAQDLPVGAKVRSWSCTYTFLYTTLYLCDRPQSTSRSPSTSVIEERRTRYGTRTFKGIQLLTLQFR